MRQWLNTIRLAQTRNQWMAVRCEFEPY